MINKIADSMQEAIGTVADGSMIHIGGFGTAGQPDELVEALLQQNVRDLVVVCNNAGGGDVGLAAVMKAGRVRKVICSYPRQINLSYVFDELYRAGKVELELIPQGNLAERIRAAGAGIGAFFCPTAVGTLLGKDKEERVINGKRYVLEYPLHADLALIHAQRGDRWGNLTYRKAGRNFGPVMAMGAKRTVASVQEVVALGEMDPETIVTPGIFVHRVVRMSQPQSRSSSLPKATV